MKRYLFFAVAAAALAVPATSLAAGTPNAASLASQSCKSQRTQMGATLFTQAYGGGANAYGKCVSRANRNASAALQNAAEQCKSQQADASFADAHGGKTFDVFYGANGKGKGAAASAYANCVSTTAQAATQAQTKTMVAAARTCKAQRSADKAAFASAYGSKPNALGLCVSKAASKNK